MSNLSKKELEHIFAENFQSSIFPVLAQNYFFSKEYEKAKKVCEIGLSHDQNNLLGKYILAKIYLVNDKILKAEKLLQDTVLKDQNNFNALMMLIEVKIKLKRSNTTVKKLINRAFKILPENKIIKKLHNPIIVKKKISKKNKEAIKDISKSIVIDQKMATKTMYTLMLKQSKLDIAKKILETMITNNNNMVFAKKELKKMLKSGK